MTISCGYVTATALPVTWIINGTLFTQEEIVNNPLYQLNNPISPMRVSLTVFSISGTTTFQCIVLSTPNIISTRGTVIVTNGTYVNILSFQTKLNTLNFCCLSLHAAKLIFSVIVWL